MKLHSPEFEKRLRREVRQKVRSSPELRKEARRTRKAQNYSARLLSRIGLAALPGIAVWWVSGQTQKPAAALAVVSLWLFIWLCVRVQTLLTRLYADPDLSAFSFLPIESDRIFRWQLQKLLGPAVMSLVDVLAALLAFGWFHDFTPAKWAMLLVIGLLLWVNFLALVLWCAARWPRLPYGLVPAACLPLVLVWMVGRDFMAKYLVALINRFGLEINLLLPTGWPLSLGRLLVEKDQWLSLLLLIPIAGVIWTMKSSLARLRENYEFAETTIDEAPDLFQGEEAVAPPTVNALQESPHHLGVTAIEEIVLSRQFFTGPKWHNQGRLEKMLWAWFKPREQALSEFVFPEGFRIAAPWRKIFRNLFIAMLAALLFGLVSPGLRAWALGLGMFVPMCQALAQILGTGRAFQPSQCSGVNIPIYAVYAIGFRELARLLFKCSFVQLPLFIPFIALCATPIAWLAGLPVLDGIILGLKAGGLLLAARFITVTLAFSSGTNDTSRLRFRNLSLLAAVLGLGLLFLALGAAGLFAPVSWMAWSSFALAVLDAYVFFRVYGWFYHANRFDLMKVVA